MLFETRWIAVVGMALPCAACGGGDHPPIAAYENKPGTSASGGQTSMGGSSPGTSGGADDPVVRPTDFEALLDSTLEGNPPCTLRVPDGLCFVSTDEDFIGKGKSLTSTDTAKVSGFVDDTSKGGIVVTADAPVQWVFGGLGPLDSVFVPGLYPNLNRYYASEADVGSFHFSGDLRTCSKVEGGFYLREVGRDAFGQIIRASATFAQVCDNGGGLLLGAINFNANGELDAIPETLDCDVPLPTGYCDLAPPSHAASYRGYARLSPEDVTFEVGMSSEGAIEARMIPPDPAMIGYAVSFAPPANQPLAVGKYKFDGTSSNDSRCRSRIGDFEVLDFARSGPILERAAVDFKYSCGTATAEMVGKFRYNAE